VRHLIVRVDEDLAVAERAAANRKSSMAERRIKRGLPPEPTEAERRRHREDSDDDDVMGDAGFVPSGDRSERGDR